jgi:hypothetical protein
MGSKSEDMEKALYALRGIEPKVIGAWVEKIKSRAKKECNDPDCKRIKIEYKENEQLRFKVSDIGALDCIKKSIEFYKNTMPVTTRLVFTNLITLSERELSSN